jgi:hypothetical protein
MSEIKVVANTSESENKLTRGRKHVRNTRSRKHVTKREQATFNKE